MVALPGAELGLLNAGDDLEVLAVSAHDALDTLHSVHGLDDREGLVQKLLGGNERRLIIIC